MRSDRLKRLNELADEMLKIFVADKDESPFMFARDLTRLGQPTNEIVLVTVLIRVDPTKSIKAAALPPISGSQPVMQTCHCCNGSGQVRS